MPRVARIVVPGLPHHITQRGNNRQDVFFTADDRHLYLRILLEQAQEYGLDVHGYCLMTNHIHLIATPRHDDSLARAVGRTHVHYTQTINRLHGRSGHLWQNRFFSCVLDEGHLRAAMRYIERNPVRAKMCRVPWRYPWSSAVAHCGEADRSGLLDLKWWAGYARPATWKRMLIAGEKGDTESALRRSTTTGRPLASDKLLSKLESKLGRRLRPLPRGRPWPKKKSGSKAKERI